MTTKNRIICNVVLVAYAIAAFAPLAANASLPEGYTEVEYIASSGTQYIDTGVVPKSTTRLVCDFRFMDIPTVSGQPKRCGWGSSSKAESFLFGIKDVDDSAHYQFAASVSSNWEEPSTGIDADTQRHVFDIAKGSQKFDGTEFATVNTLGNTADSTQTLYLFASHAEWGSGISYLCSMEIYSCKIYDGAALVRDFVPAVNDSNGEAGLYDCVTGTFFTNQGTGAFIAGNAAHAALADGYTELEYIYMEGGSASQDPATHCVDTGVIPSGDWSIKTDFAYVNKSAGLYSCLFCARGTGNADSLAFWLFSYSTGQNARMDIQSGMKINYVLSQYERHVAEIKPSSSGKVAGYIDGVMRTDEIAQFGTCHCPLVLFCVYTATGEGTYGSAKYSFEGWFYSLTADDASGGRRLDLVPARRNSDDAIGLYDRVSETFLTNQGTGAFVAGPEIVQDQTFVVSPIPNQTVSSVAELLAGVEPSVTVSNLTAGAEVELVLGTDYTVTYTGNNTIGLAFAVVAGRGEYAAYTNNVVFSISGLTAYYIVGGTTYEGAGSSSVNGAGSPTGWSTTKGGSKSMNGVTAANSIYYVWTDRSNRTSYDSDCATHSTSAIVIEPSCSWKIGDKMLGHTLTLNNLLIRAGGSLKVDVINDSGTLFNNTIAGNYILEDGATLWIASSKNSDAIKQYTLSASVTGRGAIVMPTSSASLQADCLSRITGNITGFTGDIRTWTGGQSTCTLELVNAVSLPGDPAPEEVAYVVVTNSATLKIDQDWTSPTNRIWVLGDAGTPSINIPSGKTVEIDGDLVGTVGFTKTGLGTLVLRGASPDLSGEVTIAQGILRLAGPGARLAGAEGVTITAAGGTYETEMAALTISPIPDQTVSSIAALDAGVTPSVTVSNLDAHVELVLGRDYTVSYSDNRSIGTAHVTVAGLGEYAAFTNNASFLITGITAYYIVGGSTSDSTGASTVSGDGTPSGWSATKGAETKDMNGITVANAIYYVWKTSWCRTPPAKNYATPATSAIVVEPSCTWELGDKMRSNTLTLNNLSIRDGGRLVVSTIGDGVDTFSNTYAGNWTMEGDAFISIAASKESDETVKQYTLAATVTGSGAIVMPSTAKANACDETLLNKVTGNISGFTGDIGTWNGYNAVSLELVNANSLPGDPAPGEIAYVIVTNGATLKIDNDWTSPTNRIWILGDAGTPTIEVASGKTVEINGDLVGSTGFVKKGTGTLVLRGASPAFSGEITISSGKVRFSGQGAHVAASAGVTLTEAGGTYDIAALTVSPVPAQTVNSLAALAAGVRPTLVVSNIDTHVELVLGTEYTVSYSNNTAYGVATATAIGAGEYEGMERSVNFIIHAVKEVSADYNLLADEDWTGFESVTVASGVTIDLKGHSLTISGLNGTGTITDTVGGGELHYAVPAIFASGYEATITGVSLTGKLKLVKEGAGMLTTVKYPQTYSGGTRVAVGILRYGCANISINATPGASPFGTDMTVTIDQGGILDPAGSCFWGYHTIVLNGGMISNTVEQTSNMFNPTLVVTADSTFATEQNYFWQSPTVNLDGHTLSLWIAATGRTLDFRTVLTNGTLDAVLGGYLKSGTSISSPTLDIRINTALDMASTWSVHDYTPTYPGNYGKGTGVLGVDGTFTPNSVYFYGPTMQDGSAIDLSAKTGAWNVKSSLTNGGNPTTKFAANASVAILLGGRTLAWGEKIVSWAAGDKPADSVSLTNATYVLRVENDGIYVDSPRTFNPTFLPDIASARLASDVEAAIEASLSVTNLVTDETLALGTDYTYAYTIDHGVCTVTVTGKGDNAGVSIVRKFAIGEIGFKETDYTYSMDIAPTDGKVTAPLTNFPVLVRLSESIPGFSYDKCRADELRFALADGTLLAHDIDYWNPNGESTVWVNVPELTAETVIRAYWGFKPGREPLDRPSDEAWSDYVGVWHFSEESGIVHDSSGNGYHSTNNGGGTVSNVNAKVGLARNVSTTSLNTSASNLASTGNKKPLTTVSKFTASGWMLSTLDIGVGSNAKYPQMMRNKNNWSDDTGWFAGYEGTSVAFNAVGSGSKRTIFDLPRSVYNNWVYLTIVYDGATTTIYEDGALVGSYAIDTVKANTSYGLRFGQDLTGRIDEYRIRNGLQSAAYVSADYATQTDFGFLTFGEIQSHGGFYILVR